MEEALLVPGINQIGRAGGRRRCSFFAVYDQEPPYCSNVARGSSVRTLACPPAPVALRQANCSSWPDGPFMTATKPAPGRDVRLRLCPVYTRRGRNIGRRPGRDRRPRP